MIDFVIIFFILSAFFGFSIFAIRRAIKISVQFNEGRNHCHRICADCGQHQEQYRSNVEGYEYLTWWEEVHPLGNDENCNCKKYLGFDPFFSEEYD